MSEFYELTPREFYYAIEDYNKVSESNSNIIYDSMRIQTYYLLCANPYIKKKDKPKSPKSLLKFESEVQTKRTQTVEQMKQIMYAMSKSKKGKKKGKR